MKRIYFASLCALLCMPAVSANRFKSRSIQKPAAVAYQAPAYVANDYTVYIYNGVEWFEYYKVANKYDSRHNLIEITTTYQEDGEEFAEVKTNTYNDNDMLASTTVVDDGVNYQRMEYLYDDVVTDYRISRMGYSWSNNAWVENQYCETNTITRNDAGNIVSIVKALPYGEGELVDAYKNQWTYGADNKATSFELLSNNAATTPATWQSYDGVVYRDITWDRTNGQMTGTDMSEFTSGANRIATATIYYDNEIDGYFFVEYNDKYDADYKSTETLNDKSAIAVVKERRTTADNGSYEFISQYYYDDDYNFYDEPYLTISNVVSIDEHGNVAENATFEEVEGDRIQVQGYKYEYTYDAAGNPSSVIENIFDFSSQEYVPNMRTDYGSYSETGIEDLTTDASCTRDGDNITFTGEALTGISVYNMQGIRVAAVAGARSATISIADLQSGLYIIKAEGLGRTLRIAK